MAKVVLGLGSNLGDRAANLKQAMITLSEHIADMRSSCVWQSAAVLPDGAPEKWDVAFYNMAVMGDTQLNPAALLFAVKQAEKKLGRKERERWAPREIDIDILAYDDAVIKTEALMVPHPYLLERDFALLPLAELWPDWCYPLAGEYLGSTAQELVEQRDYGENENLIRVQGGLHAA